jgi:kumamolisin
MTIPNIRPALRGSLRTVPANAHLVGQADDSQKIKVSIYARQNPAGRVLRTQLTYELSMRYPRERHYLSKEQFESAYGADPADVKRITDWLKAQGLSALSTYATDRRILVEGDIGRISAAFGTRLNVYDHPTLGRFRGREGSIRVDEDVLGLIEGVFGLDTRQVGRPRYRRLAVAPQPWEAATQVRARQQGGRQVAAKPTMPNQWPGTFFPPQVASLYDYPPALDGSSENIAVFAFNGGKQGDGHGGYSTAALKTYFEQVLGGSMPKLQNVVVQGPGNNPGPDTPASERLGDATGEVMLDLCVVGSIAPRANIFVYFTEFTTQGWVDALHAAITDNHQISVISISYGNPEDDPQGAWNQMGVKVVDQALQAAVAKGITICVAAGDDGSSDDESTGAHVDFPASSPWVLAVGGTKLIGRSDKVAQETVWNEVRFNEGAGGGGVSVVFSRPDYQSSANVPPAADPPHRIGRGVPDVAAVADPVTGVVIIHVDGQHLEPIGGTSASAPLWASLIARVNQGLKARCGFLNPLLYTKLNKGVLRDITVGSIGAYSARRGWDACTGFGSPGGGALLKALSRGQKAKGAAAATKNRASGR